MNLIKNKLKNNETKYEHIILTLYGFSSYYLNRH